MLMSKNVTKDVSKDSPILNGTDNIEVEIEEMISKYGADD